MATLSASRRNSVISNNDSVPSSPRPSISGLHMFNANLSMQMCSLHEEEDDFSHELPTLSPDPQKLKNKNLNVRDKSQCTERSDSGYSECSNGSSSGLQASQDVTDAALNASLLSMAVSHDILKTKLEAIAKEVDTEVELLIKEVPCETPEENQVVTTTELEAIAKEVDSEMQLLIKEMPDDSADDNQVIATTKLKFMQKEVEGEDVNQTPYKRPDENRITAMKKLKAIAKEVDNEVQLLIKEMPYETPKENKDAVAINKEIEKEYCHEDDESALTNPCHSPNKEPIMRSDFANTITMRKKSLQRSMTREKLKDLKPMFGNAAVGKVSELKSKFITSPHTPQSTAVVSRATIQIAEVDLNTKPNAVQNTPLQTSSTPSTPLPTRARAFTPLRLSSRVREATERLAQQQTVSSTMRRSTTPIRRTSTNTSLSPTRVTSPTK